MSDMKAAREAAARAIAGADLNVKDKRVRDFGLDLWEVGPRELYVRFANAAIDAYLAARRAEGFVEVPREPTEAMWEAAVFAHEFHTPETEYSLPRAIYRAMLKAAEEK